MPLHTVLKTIHALTKPRSVLFHKKNENIHPFDSTESLEFLANKNDCGIVVFGSSNKKRPNCMTLMRVFDSKTLDICELLLLLPDDSIPAMNNLTMHIGVGMKPMILFAGSPWEDPTSTAHVMLKSMLLDLFKGEETDKIDVEGLQYLLIIAAEEPNEAEGLAPIVRLRWYKIRTKRSGYKMPRVELDEVGPKFDFKVGRLREAPSEVMKEAMKQGKRPNENMKAKKNIDMDPIGDKVGRVHLGKQDLGGLQTRKMKGLKRRAGVDSDEEEEGADADMMDVDGLSDDDEDDGPKRRRN